MKVALIILIGMSLLLLLENYRLEDRIIKLKKENDRLKDWDSVSLNE